MTSEFDIKFIKDYVDTGMIAYDVRCSRGTDLTGEEARIAAEAISSHRARFVISALKKELFSREAKKGHLLTVLDGACIVDVRDAVGETQLNVRDLGSTIKEDGRFVCFEDFQLANRQVRMGYEAVTGLFHTLTLFFLEDTPGKRAAAEQELRYSPYNQPWSYATSPTHHYFLSIDALEPYAREKVTPEYKIPGVGSKGRRLIRAVLFDEEDIEDLLLAEQQRFN